MITVLKMAVHHKQVYEQALASGKIKNGVSSLSVFKQFVAPMMYLNTPVAFTYYVRNPVKSVGDAVVG